MEGVTEAIGAIKKEKVRVDYENQLMTISFVLKVFDRFIVKAGFMQNIIDSILNLSFLTSNFIDKNKDIGLTYLIFIESALVKANKNENILIDNDILCFLFETLIKLNTNYLTAGNEDKMILLIDFIYHKLEKNHQKVEFFFFSLIFE